MLETKTNTIIYLGSDHAGFSVKPDLKEYLKKKGYDVVDLGTFSDEAYDYPDVAREVGEKVLERAESFGILLCGSGIGVSIGANRMKGIRCVNARDLKMVEMSRLHNDCNVLAMGARDISVSDMKKFIDKFLNTEFLEEERHIRRNKKLDMI